MKKNKKVLLIISLFSFLFSLSSCDKKEDVPLPDGNPPIGKEPTEIIPTGTLMVHLHNYIDISEVDDYNIVYTTSEERKISMEIGQFYLSNFELLKADGTIYNIPDSVVLKLQEVETYVVANVPVGNYKGLSFHVGLNNKQDKLPAKTSSKLNRPEMWFGNAPEEKGYVFFNFQGKIDTTKNGEGKISEMVNFKYLIGTPNGYKKVTMPPQPFSILPNKVEYAHMYADYSRLFSGIDLNIISNLSIATPEDNASPRAAKFIENIGNIFIYE